MDGAGHPDPGNASPGNANLPIGAVKGANQEIGVPRATQESGVPGECANREIGVPRATQESGVPRTTPEIGGPKGWHSRGYLPHCDDDEKIQHVTFHLADSLPADVLRFLEEQLKSLPPEKRDVERRKRMEALLDAGHGSCVLREPGIGRMVEGALLFFDAQRYQVIEWAVMPNHVHVLFQPMKGWSVAKIVASWKKFTATHICAFRRSTAPGHTSLPGNANLPIGTPPGNANLPIGAVKSANREIGVPRSEAQADDAPDPVWHREYWDRYIRDDRHFERAVGYIRQNPVKAGLVAKVEDWPWGSARFRESANPEIGVPRSSEETS